MPITTDKDLKDNVRSLWLKALSAVELRNYGYSISLINAVRIAFPSVRETTATRAPSLANRKAIAWPRPRPAPVTMAT
jgi:hypothetical protein